MLNYFFDHYISQNGYAYILTDLFYSFSAVILLNEIRFTVRNILLTFVKAVAAWGIVFTFVSLYYWRYPQSSFGYFATSILFMICAVIIFKHYGLPTRIIWGSVYAITWIFSYSIIIPFQILYGTDLPIGILCFFREQSY